MPNKYFSVERRVWAAAVAQDTLAVPAVITINTVAPKFFSINQAKINPNSNMVISRLGLFSNFADGLVWRLLNDRIWIACTAYAFNSGSDITGVSNPAGGTQTINGVGTQYTTDLAVNDYITNGFWIWKVSSITNDTTLSVREWIEFSGANQTIRKLTTLGTDVLLPFQIRTLNDMYDCNEFIQPAQFATSAVGFMAIEATLALADAATEFLTDSINPAFNGDVCHFDVSMDLEFTERG